MKNSLLRNMTMASTRMKYLLLVSLWLTSLTKSVSAQELDQLICQQSEDSVKIIICGGFLPTFTYREPYFQSSTVFSHKLIRIEGPASGSLFPVGTTRVTYVAYWICDPILESTVMCTDTCTFTVTVIEATGAMYYHDFDRDGWGDRNNPDSVFECVVQNYDQWSRLPGDCDDSDPLVYRTAFLYQDVDGDGYTISRGSICWGDEWPSNVPQPGVDPGWASTPLNGFDCDDSDPAINGEKYFYRDADNDGYPDAGFGTGGKILTCRVLSGCPECFKLESELKSIQDFDCNDLDPAQHPDQFWFSDNDGDHHGHGILAGGQAIQSCTRPPGNWFALSELISVDDCDDYDSLEHPGQFWFLDNDGDRHGGQSIQSCNRPPGNWFASSELISVSDCDDDNRFIHPGATEYCGGDYNCDGKVSEPYCCPPFNIIYVNAANTAGVQDGTSWARAFKHLQDALETARRCYTVTQIWVAAGTYYSGEGGIGLSTFQPRGGLAIYGGFAGTETLLSQRILSSAASILSGDNNVIHVVTLDNISTPFVLDGFTIRDGFSNIVLPEILGSGTGILVVNCPEGGAVLIRNCMITNNVGRLGAAITNINSRPIYINCVVTGNTTTVGNGAIWNNNSSPSFFNCSIANNAITGNDFIVIRNTGSSIPLIINSIVRGTSPAMDGGTPDVANSLVQDASVFPGGGNVAGDPMFVNEAAGDLHLRSGSPVINSGSDIGNSEPGDIEGNNRKIGMIDMGAYEFQSSVPACTAISLTTTTLSALQTSGCGTAAIASVTFAYSTTPVTLTAAQYATLNLSISDGSCAIATVEYTDAIDQALSAPGKIVVVRKFTVTDVNHATAMATQQIKVVDATSPTVLTKNITVQLTAGGNVKITPAQINNGSFDACGIQTFTLSKSTFLCSNIGANTVTLTATDANGNTASANATVTVEDNAPPTVLTKNITVQLTPGGNVIITPAQVNNGSFDACGIQSISLSKTEFICGNLGNNTVTLTVTDVNGNTASATAIVKVEDKAAPTVLTKNITVQLTPGGNVIITPAQVNNGSFDACGIQSISLSKTEFICSNLGNNTITLTVTDVNGNSASKTAIVTVEDNAPPTVLTKNITVQLTPGGNVVITPAQVNNGSFDACGIQSISLSKTEFICGNLGNNTVTLTVTDVNGNTASKTAIVTVEDNDPPTVLTKNITVQLTPGGNVIITPAQVNNGSFDACGIQSISLSKTEFICGNLGNNTVTLTVTDVNGNTASATATVTVEDHVPPTMFTKNITAQLNAGGTVSISPNDVNNGSYDACSISNYSLSKSTFNCSNVGPNTVTLKATDANGNTATASAVVTVEDKIKPVIISCPTIPLQCYNANGTYTIPVLTATDNCGTPSISYVISGATSRSGNSSNASGVFNPGTSVITWKVTDVNNNTATCTTTVKVDKVDATIGDAYASGISSSIGSPNTIYIGYGGSSVTLTAQVTSSLDPNTYVYKWTTGSPAGPGFATTQSITVSPSATTTYFVSIKDANGCAPVMQVSKQVQVVDIRCGNNRINVCQFKNGSYSTVCVSSSPKTINSLPAGSYLGACVQSLTSSKIIPEENITGNLQVRAMPNPTNTNFRITVNSMDLKAPVKLLVTDMLGRVIETRITNAGQTITIGDKYISGTYAVRIIQGHKIKQLTLIKLSD